MGPGPLRGGLRATGPSWSCPLVEGSDRVQATSVVAEAERLAGAELAGLRVGLLHGQLPSAEKERVMAEFRSGRLDVLVATTVIEVGVDIPEASVMVIEDADRFGIAQLHQLRGRVGRGREPAWCYLLSENDTPEAEARLSAMERSTDGFVLAEVDLGCGARAPSSGRRQKGRSDLKLAKLLSDQPLVAGPGPWPWSWWPRTPSWPATRCWSTSCGSSSTTTRPSSCSRADGRVPPAPAPRGTDRERRGWPVG